MPFSLLGCSNDLYKAPITHHPTTSAAALRSAPPCSHPAQSPPTPAAGAASPLRQAARGPLPACAALPAGSASAASSALGSGTVRSSTAPMSLGPMQLPVATTGARAGAAAAPPHELTVCLGYVGQGARPAAEYHECDFDWHEHAASVRHIVEAQEAQALAQRLASVPASSSSSGPDSGAEQRLEEEHEPSRLGQLGAGQARRPGQGRGQQQGEQQGRLAAVGTGTCGGNSAGSSGSEGSSGSDGRGSGGVSQGWRDALNSPPAAQGARTGQGQEASSGTRAASCSGRGDGDSDSSASLPHRGVVATHPLSASQRPQSSTPSASASTSTPLISGPGVAVAGSASASASTSAASTSAAAYEGSKWEEFYRSHPSARFFKERRYLLLEFPHLLTAKHVAEIGCGCGSSILPVLKANPEARATCTDISTTCLDQLVAAADAEGIDRGRLSVFPADATDPAAGPSFSGHDSDALLIMFTLSAVPPEQQAVMLRHAAAALAPGGRLMIRDHGLYDMVQLRIPADQWVGPNLYKRGDGTMAYFFSTEDLSQRAADAGLRTLECKYVTVFNRNRKTGMQLRRVFVHGVFQKPPTSPADVAAP